jgi:hypothetical protein
VTPVLELQEVLGEPMHRQRGVLRGEGENQRVAPAFFTDADFVTAAAPALGEANADFFGQSS